LFGFVWSFETTLQTSQNLKMKKLGSKKKLGGRLFPFFNTLFIIPIVIPIVIQMELLIPIVRLNKATLQTSQSLKMKKLHSNKNLVGRLL